MKKGQLFLALLEGIPGLKSCVVIVAGLLLIGFGFLLTSLGVQAIIQRDFTMAYILVAGFFLIFFILIAFSITIRSQQIFPGAIDSKQAEQLQFGDERQEDNL